ncbi:MULTISPECIES: zinc-dependent alcohol dehydrogenase family protein [Streptomyces]|uniref:zinc-dependent alcohol dehydrogenase family protein n=1 Tax=Streptomyces TaxID=1883 RepID=UPI00163B63A6|nr:MULTISPECIES: zinc-dependent alcohol dehydrogenase family protein [Streptomyces]MBC2874266.1 zinc-dependent alcohol dehydrogenase family protein [Streptomyces sp. TYQ1024]UBI40301.1 zinc-dependent alcohol dehydrogenase family protein [Streptomyces mobaraensis]UKW32881.1 zinc-dependent alcohol dehydrogenase family protein [Streptomyces sp. TYQ1024]
MRATLIHASGDVRLERLPDPKILKRTDAVIRTVATCVCGTDLWAYRGVSAVDEPRLIGHEYVGIVEETGSEVSSVKPGQFVIGSFFASDNTCPHCRAGYQSSCLDREFISGCQAEYVRVPLADGTLVALDGQPDEEHIPSLLTLSDVMGTGWYAAVAARIKPGDTVAVVGDGAVGQSAVIAAGELGAERIIIMSRHASRQRLALAFGATDVVADRGDMGVAQIKGLTGGVGADAVLECVGTAESMRQAIRSTRPGGNAAFVGVPHGVQIDGRELFDSHVALRGGPAPVRRFLPHLIERVLDGRINPGKVFDLVLPLDQVAEGYQAMDERRAVKALLLP